MIRSQVGVKLPPTVVLLVPPPVELREVHWTPDVGVMTSDTFLAFSASDSRIMIPALAPLEVFSRLSTRTVMEPLPSRDWYKY